ncbi:exo-beta-N-acetylmuramidase NamZ domain-containing protein [Flagellimonas sp.]|uniref:exo-beta-N-acetylmuramidase NamZ family protein n=1 Tax=Flagellimonas sp. TaxID=2058762 RepID=UPI003B5AD361
MAKKLSFCTHFLPFSPFIAQLCNLKKSSTAHKTVDFRFISKRSNEFIFKSTVLLLVLLFSSCRGQEKSNNPIAENVKTDTIQPVEVAANRSSQYLPLLKGKAIGIIANQTSVVFKEKGHTHLVDSLLSLEIKVEKVFAPEHGFRGKADAGEYVKDGMDAKTGLPIVSLYGKNRKPSKEQLQHIDMIVFDIQDVGVRFYTYIATLQLVMEACANNNIPILVLDRPNPNGHYVDGPTMKEEHTGFLGMTEIPLVYGMTIGEYAQMINGEGWLENGKKANLTVVQLKNYTHDTSYHLPIRPSPNLPSDTAINLYPSLGLFEGTNVNAGRGTEFQFQRYGASFLDSTTYDFSYVPQPNFGSKHPKEEGKKCFGKDLSKTERMDSVSLQWLIDAYGNSVDKSNFFKTSSFTKHAGTPKLQKQIEAGSTEQEIKDSWQEELEAFKNIRKKYLIYD